MHTSGSTRRLRQRIAPARASSPSRTPPVVHSSVEDDDASGESQPHEAKRARKVINCEPCRTSKLKCDRNRPCSSCELRGTVHQCYQDTQHGAHQSTPIDPLAEMRKIRQSIALIEQHIRYTQSLASSERSITNSNNPPPPGPNASAGVTLAKATLLKPAEEVEVKPEMGVLGPGVYGRQARGLYAGPTSTSSHLHGHDTEGADVLPATSPGPETHDHADLRQELPDMNLIDDTLDYYFTYCQWLNPHIIESSFRKQWNEYKSTGSLNHLTLAVCCCMLALTMNFIPDDHPLKHMAVSKLGRRPHEKLFNLTQMAQQRYEDSHGSSAYCLEFAELLLIRGNYYLYTTQGGEELWAAKSRLISVATAMGLHRDPSQWKMPIEVAERRRWLWWMILTWSRWQSILIGRPPSIAAHHCDPQFPGKVPGSAPVPEIYDSPRQFFALGDIVNGIVDDALSLRPVPYSNVRRHDRALERWKRQLPPKFALKHTEILSGVCSDVVDIRRRAVQCVSLLSSYHHIRFTLHRPYASCLPTVTSNVGPTGETQLESIESAGIAATSAEELINVMISCQCAFDLPPERACSTPGYFAYISFYLFTAAMFFSFQLIAAPVSSRAKQYRENIARARTALRKMTLDMPGGQLAAHAIMILDTIEPLWQNEFVNMPNGPKKEDFKSQVFASVRQLAFPFHDPNASKVKEDPAGEAVSHASDARDTTIFESDHSLARSQPAAFGTCGTLMPDMSVSGRTPVMYEGARERWSHHVPSAEQYTSPHHQAVASIEIEGGPTIPSHLRTMLYPESAIPNQDAKDRVSFLQHAPTLTSTLSTGSWSSSSQSDYFGPSQYQYQHHPLSQPIPQPPSTWVEPSGTPSGDIVNAQYGMGVGAVSQEMPWGASMGIDSMEWTRFTRLMAGPSYIYASDENHAL